MKSEYPNFLKYFNPNALRKAYIVYNFGLSACNRAKVCRTPTCFSKFANRDNLLGWSGIPSQMGYTLKGRSLSLWDKILSLKT